jgi:WD40 repeat protein
MIHLFSPQRRRGAETAGHKTGVSARGQLCPRVYVNEPSALVSFTLLRLVFDTAALRSLGNATGLKVGIVAMLVLCGPLFAAEKPTVKGLPIAKIKHSGPVDFEREILPILKNNCLACHNETKPKGGLVLETPQKILKGGDNGPAVVPKKAADSLLFRAAAHQDPELIMPPPDNKVAAVALKPAELGLLQLWIEQGAKGEVRASAPIVWQSMPAGFNVIYAVALTRDGQYAACGRGNQIFVYHLPSQRLVARLNDPQIQKTSGAGAAHRDTVNSLAFSPDGELLASGGYREVKLWRHGKRTQSLPTVADFDLLLKSGKLLSAIITNGQLQVLGTNNVAVRTNTFSKAMAELKGDYRARFVMDEQERESTFAKSEVEFRTAALKTAESNHVAAVSREKKAGATNAILAKTASDKANAVTNAVAARREAEKGVEELGPEVSKLVETFFAAEKEFTNATALVKAADKAKVETLLAELVTKSNLLAEAKSALEKLPAETKAAQKSATDKLIAANKAIPGAEKEFSKAEQERKTAEHEWQLAQDAMRKREAAVADAKSALSNGETEVKKAEAGLESAKQSFTKTESAPRSLAYALEDQTLVTLDEAGRVRFWSPDTGAPMDSNWKASWSLERAIGSGDGNSPLSDRVNALCFNSNGKELFTGGGEPTRGGEIKCWRVKDGSFIREFQNVHSDSVLALAISPDGNLIVSGAADRLAKTVDLTTGKVLKVFEGHTHQVLGVAWKRDARTLMTAGADNIVKTWDAATGERRKNIEGFGKEITAAAFVGVSDEAVLSGGDGQVILMKANGEKVRSFAGASDYVYAAAATADGAVIVAGGADGILRVWDGKTAKLLAQF